VAAYPGVFSATVSHLIRCGEVTGQMPEVLQEIVRSLKWQDELSAHTRKLLLYPAFVTLVVGSVFIFLMLRLVPQLVNFLASLGQQVPLQTRLLIGLSQLLQQFGWAALLAASALLLATASLAASFEGVRHRLHRGQLALPLLGPVLKKIALARFADTLAMMYRAGIPLTEALAYCQQVSANLVVQRAIRRARERVLNGASLSDSFAAEMLFPPLVVRMLQVGEATGALDSSLSNIGYFYRRDIDQSVGRVQALMEPLLTLLLGLLLGWIMLAVLVPIYDSLAVMRT
jgi:type IV pilus assembly protein PilC